MNRLFGGWGAKKDAGPVKSPEEEMVEEKDNLRHALAAASRIMDDDLEGAIKELAEKDSAYHDMGAAVTFFMRSVLGLEKEAMADASNRLAEVENRAWHEMKRLQKRGKVTGGSDIYPPGTEMEIVVVQAQLMSAVVGVLHENLVEAMKGFLKLRKAFISLDAIMAIEAKETERRSKLADEKPKIDIQTTNGTTDIDSDDQIDTPAFTTAQTTPLRTSSDDDIKPAQTTSDPELHFDNPLDVFIHSASNMCFGMIMLMLSLLPPSFSKVLAVVGFRGDRARGVKMLWSSASHPNMNGAIAALMLLAYYNGLLGAVDISPAPKDYDESAETVGAPREKCMRLLEEMRTQFPKSRLWRVQESVMAANQGDVQQAIEILTAGEPAKMKQIAAINNFELSLNRMMAQDWAEMRDDYLRCLELNDWSPAMYYFMAGCASLEMYRDAVVAGDETEAKLQKSKVEGYFEKAPSVIGKKRLMARQLPLETYLQHRIQRWQSRAKDLGVDLADAIGSPPVLEMIYMWNGQKRMGEAEKLKALDNMDWSRYTGSKAALDKIQADADEMAVWAICRASILKGLGRIDEARDLLEEHVTSKDKALFKGQDKNDWVMPTAIYELATLEWMECSAAEDVEVRKEKEEACRVLLNKAKAWEAYTLDARMGMRIQSSLETLDWFRRRMEWS